MARTRPRAARVHYEESSDECVKADARFMNDIITYISSHVSRLMSAGRSEHSNRATKNRSHDHGPQRCGVGAAPLSALPDTRSRKLTRSFTILSGSRGAEARACELFPGKFPAG